MILDPFMVKALCGAVLLTVLTGPFGCIVLWRRLSFLSDSLSHSALSGVAVALSFGIHPFWGVMTTALFLILFLARGKPHGILPPETVLALSAHSFLALGVILFNTFAIPQTEFSAYLFGDILSLRWHDLGYLALGTVAGLGILAYLWRRILIVCISDDLAAIEGLNPAAIQIGFMILLGVLIALGLRIFGALLVSAMLIIPAASARLWAKNPNQMAILATIFGIISGVGGVLISFYYDLPTAPAMVLGGAVLYSISLFWTQMRSGRGPVQ